MVGLKQHSHCLFLALAVFWLLAAMWAGLLRVGWEIPFLQPDLYLIRVPLMVAGFLGTLISLERAKSSREFEIKHSGRPVAHGREHHG